MNKTQKSGKDPSAGGPPEGVNFARMKRYGRWGIVFTIAAGLLTVGSLLTCAPIIYPVFIFIFLFIIPVVFTLGFIFVINNGYWDWISGILSGGIDAAVIVSKVWIWPEIAGVLCCIAAIAFFSLDKRKNHTGGIIICALFIPACILFAILRLISN